MSPAAPSWASARMLQAALIGLEEADAVFLVEEEVEIAGGVVVSTALIWPLCLRLSGGRRRRVAARCCCAWPLGARPGR